MTNNEKCIRLVDNICDVMTNLYQRTYEVQDIFPITTELLKEIYNYKYKRVKADPRYGNGSGPESMFDKNGDFTSDNWASGQDLVRKFFEYYPVSNKVIDLRDPELHFDLMIIHYKQHDDQHYLQITLVKDDSDCCDHYFISWYKSRGRTERIYKNGRPITIAEYVDLCNIFFMGIAQN